MLEQSLCFKLEHPNSEIDDGWIMVDSAEMETQSLIILLEKVKIMDACLPGISFSWVNQVKIELIMQFSLNCTYSNMTYSIFM